MSGPGEGNGRGEAPPEDAGVLANLPRTRPQRASARRAAARKSSGTAQQDEAASGNGRPARAAPRKPQKPARAPGTSRGGGSSEQPASRPKARPKAARPRRREPDEVPRQGYESVEERATGPVQPPGGTEMIGTAAEIVSELAKAGISGGERVLRDVLSRLGR